MKICMRRDCVEWISISLRLNRLRTALVCIKPMNRMFVYIKIGSIANVNHRIKRLILRKWFSTLFFFLSLVTRIKVTAFHFSFNFKRMRTLGEKKKLPCERVPFMLDPTNRIQWSIKTFSISLRWCKYDGVWVV